jgi:hypothetical protein
MIDMETKKLSLMAAVMMFTLAISISVSQGVQDLCLVDVYGLEVIDGSIRGNIQNTGNINATVTYNLWVEKDNLKTLLKNGTLDMIPNQLNVISNSYSFGTGSYIITLSMEADCGASDSESMGHIILEGFICSNPHAIEGQTKCDYGEQEYLQCTTNGWQVVSKNEDEYCYNCAGICGDGECNCGENTTTCRRDCGTGRCRTGYMDEYRCLGSTRERKFQLSDCDTEWKDVEDCLYGCGINDECNPGPGQIAGCGVKIKTFDYMSSATPSSNPYVTVLVENTGDQSETITLSLKVGGAQKGTYSENVYFGDNFTKTLYYFQPTLPGSYPIVLNADADCGSSDVATAELSISEPGEVVEPPPGPAVVVPADPAPQTAVDFFPTLLDIVAHQSKVIVVDIDSSQRQTFSIMVEGVPESWVEYQRQVIVDREKSVYIFTTPEKTGTYELTIFVTAESEGKNFERKVDLYVAPVDSEKPEDTFLGYVTNEFTNFVSYVSQNIWAVIALIIIAIIIVIAIGHKHLKTEYEDILPK